MKKQLIYSIFLAFSGITTELYADVFEGHSVYFPEIPASYKTLNAGEMISEAKVDFSGQSTTINSTDGYTVTTPDGQSFLVDDIEKPKCAFYGTYIDAGDNPNTALGFEVVSNVYVEEVNFENCQ